MRLFSRLLAFLAVASLMLAGVAPPAFAQTYPFQNPNYTPTVTKDAQTCSAACDATFVTNGVATVTIRVAGTGTGVAATVQGTEARNGTVAWSTLAVTPVVASATAPAQASTIAGIGLWRVSTAGLASVRVHVTAVTGSIAISMAGDPSPYLVVNSPSKRQTYSAAVTALAPAASATDFLTVTGSATAAVRIDRVSCSGISTAAATATVNALVRSTANTVGTSAAMTAVPHDSFDGAATATALSYTANPTTGALVGVIRSGKLSTNTAATSAFGAQTLTWDFNPYGPQQEVVLRGIAQVFALNGAGASFTAGTALNCDVTWTEE